MNREKAIDEIKNTIRHNFAGIGVSESTDAYTGETFISIDDDKVYYGKAFTSLAAELETELLWPSGIFDVFFVASEGASVSHVAKTPLEAGTVVNAVSIPVFWTTDVLKNTISVPLAQFNHALGMEFLSPIVSAGMNLAFDPSEVGVASFATPIWNTEGVYVAALPVQNVVASNVVVVDNAVISKSSSWKIPSPRDESTIEEQLEWAA
jgi:hypothetical protein